LSGFLILEAIKIYLEKKIMSLIKSFLAITVKNVKISYSDYKGFHERNKHSGEKLHFLAGQALIS
jgi:hypothetical protein